LAALLTYTKTPVDVKTKREEQFKENLAILNAQKEAKEVSSL